MFLSQNGQQVLASTNVNSRHYTQFSLLSLYNSNDYIKSFNTLLSPPVASLLLKAFPLFGEIWADSLQVLLIVKACCKSTYDCSMHFCFEISTSVFQSQHKTEWLRSPGNIAEPWSSRGNGKKYRNFVFGREQNPGFFFLTLKNIFYCFLWKVVTALVWRRVTFVDLMVWVLGWYSGVLVLSGKGRGSDKFPMGLGQSSNYCTERQSSSKSQYCCLLK